jgi:hypothetical protein
VIVTTHAPAEIPVTVNVPFAEVLGLTDAMPGQPEPASVALFAKVTVEPVGCVVIDVICCVLPGPMEMVLGVTVNEFSAGGPVVTVT